MNIKHETEGRKGSFGIFENDTEAGMMTYTMAGDIMIIDHTEVDPAFEGKGLGKELVIAGIKHARQNNLKIKPLCPFALKTMQRMGAEVSDVLF